MKLNRKWIMVIALVMSLTMATAGTMAYLTDNDADKNTMTLGKVEIVQNEHQRAKDENGDYKTDTIDGKESYVLEAFENDKPLLPTTELNADGTPNNHGAGPYDDTTVSMSQIGSYGTVQVFKSPNAQDKIVTVTNTGRTDAYVRTIIAYEVGTATENLPNRSARYTKDNNDLSAPWFAKELGNVEIDGNTYFVCEYVYHGAQLSDGSIRHENGILPAGDTTYPSLMQVYLPALATNEDVEKLDGNNNDKYDILVLSQAVQADGFADAATALKAGFGEVNAANVQEWFSEMVIGSPGEKNDTNDVPKAAVEVGNIEELVSAVEEAFENGEDSIVVDAKKADIGALNAVITKALVPEGKSLTIKNANITGTSKNNTADGTVVFDNCTFSNNSDQHVIHFEAGSGEIIFKECELKGWASFAVGNTVEMNDCTITGNGITGTVKICGEGTLNDCTIDFGEVQNKDRIPYYIAAEGAGAKVTLNNCDLIETEIWAEKDTSVVDAGALGKFTNGAYVLVENNVVVQVY